jgi:DNA-directed RNA polymerase II subunit RPB1
LNTFHNAGVSSKSNVTRGIPRIEEILRLTKNPKNPSMTVFLKPQDQLDQERAGNFANMLEHTKLSDLVKSVQICFDPIEKNTAIIEDKLLMEQFYEFEKLIEDCNMNELNSVNESPEQNNSSSKSKWIVRMELDAENMLDKNITMDDINFAIKNGHHGSDIQCVYSDYNTDKLVFRIRVNSSILSKTKKKGAVVSLDQTDEIYLLKNFQDSLLNNVVLRGVNGIQNVLTRKLQNMVTLEDGKYNRKDIWVLETTGSNLLDTFSLDFIDYKRSYSNDIREVYNVLGIEAAKEILYNELFEVMEYAGVYINHHHLSLLCDRMTCNKDMTEIFRSGILNDNIGPLSKSTFEVHTEVLLQASRHSEFDEVNSVSSSVMLGQYGNFGTNMFNLLLDMDEFEKLDNAMVYLDNQQNEIEEMFGIASSKEGEPCSKTNIEINNNISNIKRTNDVVCDDDYNMGF